jgi:LysR family transcriptional regulator, glycine cleavage system transcriptional activator
MSMTRSRTLPLSALRAFEAAARHLSFAAAAQELGVTPAAVSYQIRGLEDRIGRQLFVRRNRAVSLSPSGMKLSAPLTELFAQMTALVAELSVRGIASLEVTAMPSFATKWLAPRLARFSVAHPDCRVRLVASDDLIDFKHSTADVGVRYGAGGYQDLHVERLMHAAAFPVCSGAFAREHAARIKTPADLVRLPLLHDETSLIAAGLPNWPRWFEAAGVRDAAIKPGLVFDSAHIAIEAALAGQGVALGLEPLVAGDLKAGRLVRLFDLEVESAFSFWFVCPRTRLKEPRIGQFRDWLKAEAGA